MSRENIQGSGATARRHARDSLRAAILAGDLAPGHRVVEEEVAALLGVTRSSVRGAIDLLIAEGLVERIPNRGARVRRLSIEESVEITECRSALESLLARKAAERITPDRASRLRVQLQQMETAVADGDLNKYSELIAGLHALIRVASRHAAASSRVESLQAQLVRYQFQLSWRPGRARASLRELTTLVEAIVAGDVAAAEHAAAAHFEGVMAALRSTPGPEGPL